MKLLLDIENLRVRETIEFICRNKPGPVTTVAEKKGLSIGGYYTVNEESMNQKILSEFDRYIDLLDQLKKQINAFYR